MDFKNWLLIERGNSAHVTINPEIRRIPSEIQGSKPSKWLNLEEITTIITDTLRRYFTRLDPRGWQYAKERYAFHINKFKNDHDGIKFIIHIELIQPKGGQEESRDGKPERTLYKTPKDAITEIPTDPNLAYRGMSWEEWQDIRRRGYIASRGEYNLGPEQEGITLFGYTPDTAENYANNFAPPQYKVGYRKPGIIIAVPKTLLLTHKDDPDSITSNELGYRGTLDIQYIKHVWILTPTSSENDRYFELTIPWKGDWDSNSYEKDPRYGFYILDTEHPKVTSGDFSVGQRYAIRKLL